jgi:hypothetical protein
MWSSYLDLLLNNVVAGYMRICERDVLASHRQTAEQCKLVATFAISMCELRSQSRLQGEAVGFEATAASVAWLRSRGLFPPAAVEDDDDWVPEW